MGSLWNLYLALLTDRLVPGALGSTHLPPPQNPLSSLPGTQNTELGGALSMM